MQLQALEALVQCRDWLSSGHCYTCFAVQVHCQIPTPQTPTPSPSVFLSSPLSLVRWASVISAATGLRPPCVGTLGCTGPAKTCHFGCRREFDWLICIALLSCNGHKCFFGLLPWLIHMRVFAGQCYDVRVLHPSSIAATFCLICSLGICQGMSWQHLHQPCVAGKVYSLREKK